MICEASAAKGRGQSRWVMLRLGLLALAALGLGAWRAGADRDDEAAPIEVRRVLLTPAQLEQELKRLREGALAQMSREEFDGLLRKAQNAVSRTTPQLAEARYRAALKHEALIGGGLWKVLHRGGPALLRLDPFNLALRQARYENHDAVIGEFDGQAAALLVQEPGEHTVALEWSARGEVRPEGLQFDLKFPQAPAALLELDVPAGRTLVALDGALLAGPGPAESADRALWRVSLGGRTQVNLLIRPEPTSSRQSPALMLAKQRNVQRLSPDGLEAAYEVTLESFDGRCREVQVLCDPGLRVRDVSAAQLESWEVRPGAAGEPSRLIVRFRQSLRETTVAISCLAPLHTETAPDAGTARPLAWRSPALRVEGAAPRGESLELWLHPDLQIASWHPAAFRLIEASPVAEEDPSSPRWQRLSLQGGGMEFSGSALADRPHGMLLASAAAYNARQLLWWQLGSVAAEMTVDLRYDVHHGLLFQLPVALPAGWVVDRVQTEPTSLLRTWSVRTRQGRNVLLVDLTRPLGPAQRLLAASPLGSLPLPPAVSRAPVLTVRLRSAAATPVVDRPLPFPDVVPLGAGFREGALAISFDPQAYADTVRTEAEPSEPGEGPWGSQRPARYYAFHAEPLTGTLLLQARAPVLRAHGTTDVSITSDQAAFQTRLQVQADAGITQSIDLNVSGTTRPLEWLPDGVPAKVGRAAPSPVRRAERRIGVEIAQALSSLAAHDPLQAATLMTSRPRCQQWRIFLAQPLRSREPLQIHAIGKPEPMGDRWEVPLAWIGNAAQMEGEVRLHLGSRDLVTLEPAGLHEVAAQGRRGPALPWRTLEYGPAGATLAIRRSGSSAGRAAESTIDRAALVTYVGPGNLQQHLFTFELAHWSQDRLVVRLPPGARLRAALVDGRWLPDVADKDKAPGYSAVTLPVPRGAPSPSAAGPRRFELLYTTPLPAGWLWTRVEATAPQLPLVPTTFRRSWQLPPGMLPLDDASYPTEPGNWPTLAARGTFTADLFRLRGLPGPWPQARVDPAQAQTLAGAAFALRQRQGGPTLQVRQVVQTLAFEYLGARFPLVVDARALQVAGISARTPIPPAADTQRPWEASGLAVVPAGGLTLLTTLRQTRTWRDFAPTSMPWDEAARNLPPPVQQAVTLAAAFGQDPSGRFLTPLQWLQMDSQLDSTDRSPPSAVAGLDLPSWQEWEAVAGAPADALTVVQTSRIRVLSLALTSLLLLAVWHLRRAPGRLRVTLLVVGLALSGCGLLWLPSALSELAFWPLALGCILACGSFLLAARRGSRSGWNRRPATLAASGMLLGAWVLRAAGPSVAPVCVFLLPPDEHQSQSVLVPMDLIARLRSQAAEGLLARPAAVLTSASYEASVMGPTVEFAAVLSVFCTSAEAAPLTLPMDAVQLVGDVWVDGARAQPLLHPAGGYTIQVRGPHRHKVEFRFRVPLLHALQDDSVSLALPPATQSRLVFHLPAGASLAQTLPVHGAQSEVTDASGRRLEADLGRLTAPLQIRWTSQGAHTPQVQYRAAYLWDLRLDGSTLRALIHYHIAASAVTQLRVGLPPALELRSAEAHRPATSIDSAAPPRIQSWRDQTNPSGHAVWLAFASPVAGDLDVLLELIPRTALPARLVLPLPLPEGQHLPGDSHLAYRNVGVEVHRGALLNVTAIRPSEFAPFWPAPSRPDSRTLGYACTLRAGAVIPLQMSRAVPQVDAEQQITYSIDRRRAQLQAHVTLAAADAEIACVDWQLRGPAGLRIAHVSGPQMLYWTQQGNHVLVWLDGPVKSARLDLEGWFALPALDVTSAGREIELPTLRVVPARGQRTRLALRSPTGLKLVLPPSQTQQLQPDPVTPGQPELRVRTSLPEFKLVVALRPQPAPDVRMLTVAAANDRHLKFTAILDYRLPDDGLRQFRFRVQDCDPNALHVDAPRATLRRLAQGPDGQTWEVELPRATGTYRVTLSADLNLERASAPLTLPRVSVPGAAHTDAWLSVVRGDMDGEASGQLDPIPNPANALAPWPGVAQQVRRLGGAVWRASGPDWHLRLQTRGAVSGVGGQVLLCQRSAAIADQRHWLHEATWWLRRAGNSDLTLDFPAPAHVVELAVDGTSSVPLQPRRESLWIPLSAQPTVCRVRVRWSYEDEGMQSPRLDMPRLATIAQGPCIWTVYVPPAWEASLRTGTQAPAGGMAALAGLNFHRAAAELEFLRTLSAEGSDAVPALTTARRQFATYLRFAELALKVANDTQALQSPSGQGLSQWLQALQKSSGELAAQHRWDVRADSSEPPTAQVSIRRSNAPSPTGHSSLASVDGALSAQEGTPLWWFAAAGSAPPGLRLVRASDHDTQNALAATGKWLAVLALAWLVAMFSPLATAVCRMWPEVMLLAGLWGWRQAGPTLVVLFLLLLGIAGRVLLLLAALRRPARRVPAPPPSIPAAAP